MAKFIDILKTLKSDVMEFQLLDFRRGALIGSKDKVRPHKHTELTFVTEEVNTSQMHSSSGKVGIVVWVDRGAFNAAVNQLTDN